MNREEDLGFTCRKNKDGYTIFHRGRTAAIVRGVKARRLETALAHSDFAHQQLVMARLTGNYKRGNERRATSHPRNRN